MTVRGKLSGNAPKQPWHSVSIVPGKNPCDAVLANPRRRVLSRDAPRLPLTDCSDPNHCQCKYQHHADRRGDPRRNEDTGAGSGPGSKPPRERRRPGERRARD